MTRLLHVVTMAVALSVPAAGVWAGPIEDAQAALAEKNYDQVEKSLEGVLSQREVPEQALRLSLQAAVEAAKPVTAERRVSALLKLTRNQDAELLYTGGQIAEQVGDQRLAMTRYLAYVRLKNEKTPQVEHAMVYVLRREAFVDEYRKYLQLWGPTDRAWELGQVLLNRLIEIPDADKTLEVAEMLMSNWSKDPNAVLWVHERLWAAQGNYIFGREPQERFLRPLQLIAKYIPANWGYLNPFIDHAGALATDEFRARTVAQHMAAGVPMEAYLSKFGHARNIQDENVRLELGKIYLAQEANYTKTIDHYEAYIRPIFESPQVFAIPGKALVTSADAQAKLEKYYQMAVAIQQPDRVAQFIDLVINYYIPADNDAGKQARIALLTKYINRLTPSQMMGLMDLVGGQNADALIAQHLKDRGFRYAMEFNQHYFPRYAAAKNKAAFLQGVKDYLYYNLPNLNWQHLHGQFVASDLATADEKLAILEEFVGKAGTMQAMRELAAHMARPDGQGGKWQENARFLELKKKIDGKTAPSDPVIQRYLQMVALGENPGSGNPQAAEVATAFLNEYKGRIPPYADAANNYHEFLAYNIWQRHWNNVRDHGRAMFAHAALWAPRLELTQSGRWGSNLDWVIRRVREHNGGNNGELAKLLPIYLSKLPANQTGSQEAWNDFASIGNMPADQLIATMSPHWPKMKMAAIVQVFALRDSTFAQNRQALVDALAKLVPTVQFTERGWPTQLVHHYHHWTNPNVKVALEAIKGPGDYLMAQYETAGGVDPVTAAYLYSAYSRNGYEAEARSVLDRFIALVRKQDTPSKQFALLMNFLRQCPIPVEAGEALEPGKRLHTLHEVLKPIADAVPVSDYDRFNLSGEVISLALHGAGRFKDPALKQAFTDLTIRLVDMLQAGSGADGPAAWVTGAARFAMEQAIARNDRPAAARYANVLGSHIGRDSSWDDWMANWINPVAKTLDEANLPEVAFTFLVAVERQRPPDTIIKGINIVRAKVATRIPNMIPVPPNDPSYDLFAAANEFSLGNEGRAWELTNTPQKLDTLTKSWESLDAKYVAWAIDQMRKQKGPMLKPALDFAMNVLLREQQLDAEVAAQISLTKGDIYRDMENYQAARIEYEALRNNSRYNRTEAGGRATFRLVDLLITTKDYDTASAMLERLVESENVQTQAEAYYLYALMSFQRGEYKECKDYLRRVRERVVSHVEAALLEGRLKLYLPQELAGSAEVEVGDPELATIVVPGRELTLKLPDHNLAVARAGAAIPVVITTSVGKDREEVKLLPSPTNKTLFSGTIATGLGTAVENNLVLEIVGEDTVSYEIDPEFQKANGISYPAKTLAVRSEARLVASSGEILTPEEEEKRALQRQLQRQAEFESRQLDISRDGRTIRPGSPIHVQVTDFDRDLSEAPEVVKVTVTTSSGDVLTDYELTETGPHTGIFRGQIPTAVPLPKASASDTDEAKTPAGVSGPINSTQPGIWTSLADGEKNKWYGVDTMTSNEVAQIIAEIPNLSSIRELTVQGALTTDDYEDLASYPQKDDQITGGVLVEAAADQRGESPSQIVKWVRLGNNYQAQSPTMLFSRQDTPQKGGDGWQSIRLRGAFWLDENRSIELKFLQDPSPNNWQHAYLYVDGQLVLGGVINKQSINLSKKIDLAKGAHRIEVMVRDHWRNGSINVGYRKDDGTFETLPADWFDIEKNPGLGDFLRPKGKIEIQGDTLVTTLTEPKRLRNIRLVFRDFTGTAVSVKSLAVKDPSGNAILPVPEDFTMAQQNRQLEIAPGDDIVVTYADEKRLKPDMPTLQVNLNSSFFNATVTFANEVFTENERRERYVRYFPAKRTRVGDQLLVVVADFDADVSDERDVVEVTVTTSSGESTKVQCLETRANYTDQWHRHAGVFVGTVKMGDTTGPNAIKVAPGDQITVSYLDKENTVPGVPVERKYSIFEAGVSKPEIMVYRTDVIQVEDKSPEAQARARRLAIRARKEDVKIYKNLVVASHPDYREGDAPATQPAADGTVTVSVSAPLLFEVSYPKMALNSGSILTITAVPDSELKAAEREGREPKVLEVPTYLYRMEWLANVKGYPLQLRTHIRRDDNEMLKDGIFAGVIRLQVGKAGDPVDDLVTTGEKEFISQQLRETEAGSFWYRVPTLLVSGNDTVNLRVVNESGEILAQRRVKLLSNARLELLDSSYTAENTAVHLGERFYVRVTDPDQDASDERDQVTVAVTSSSGDKITLTLEETLAHSGVFTGSFQPAFLGEKVNDQLPKPNTDDDQLQVYFGDTVNFTYVDPTSLISQGPLDITAEGKIFYGSDGELAVFSKRFKDPDIAVKTRFLMAEALFEMAKEYRKLNQKEQADDAIKRGKEILEEALRDYPNTAYAVQGEYLLANLAQELGNFQEAIGRYSHVISGWPDSEYAAESQFKKAICFEKMQNYDQACEEYVRLTYVYPESPLVADATIRLGNYYYKKQSFAIAGKVFFNFREKNKTHKLAAEALFLSAQCAYKLADWKQAIKLFQMVVDEYPDHKDVRAEAMYWMGDAYEQSNQYVEAYRAFKKVTWDYPESKWAKIARGRLTDERYGNIKED